VKRRDATATNAVRIHPSRLAVFIGESLPDASFGASLLGWGDSVLAATLSAIKNADSAAANIASLLFEAKIDVIKVPDLMNSLTNKDYEGRLLSRFSLAATAKGINGTLLLDNEEAYEQKNANFGSLDNVLHVFMQIVSGAADIPVTRFLGQSPSGLSATGEADLRNYYDRIQSIQELELTPALATLDECLIRSATGARDPGIHYVWTSLWQITDRERAEIGKLDAETIALLNNTGLFPQEALAKASINALTEHGVLPGFEDAIDAGGGLPDYEALLEEEHEAALARAEAAAAANNTRRFEAAE
jgi:uncharacterized protein